MFPPSECIYFLGLCLIITGVLVPAPAADVFWEQQGDDKIRDNYSKMLNKPCKIIRVLLGPDGRPEKTASDLGIVRSLGIQSDLDYGSSGLLNDTGGNTSNSQVDSRYFLSMNGIQNLKANKAHESSYSNEIENIYKPITDIVIDPCKDEENRSFMECVLLFQKDIKEDDVNYNTGTCMCYRDWSAHSSRIPAYNHEFNYLEESDEWFVWSNNLKECVIKTRKRCAPRGTLVVPYHCETYKDPESHRESEGRCVDAETDPYFMICVAKANILKTCPAFLLTVLLIIQYA